MKSTVVSAVIEKLENVEVVHFKNYEGDGFKPGLQYKYYEVDVLHVDELDKFQPKKTGVTPFCSIEERENDGLFAFTYSGYINIPEEVLFYK